MKTEHLARILVFALALGAGLAALAFRLWGSPGVIEVHAAMPDRGGWLTSNINARAGEPLQLRLVSDDVVHGFALGQSDFKPVEMLPGKPVDVTLTFDEPGIYTFYCTRWCGPDHWRMRGTITVAGDGPADAESPTPPLYLQLGIDLDAPHEVRTPNWDGQPASENGADLGVTLPPEILTLTYYRAHSPEQAWNTLRANPAVGSLSDPQIWDLVAWAWQQNTTSATLAAGEALYQRDCAACHGVEGAGDGIFAPIPPLPAEDEPGVRAPDGHSAESPTNFQDAAHMLAASPALLQGKIIRGGMGTGMPSWGRVYTAEQTWALVDYLWAFVFNYSLEE